jgi:hypothetical protein
MALGAAVSASNLVFCRRAFSPDPRGWKPTPPKQTRLRRPGAAPTGKNAELLEVITAITIGKV